MFPTIGATEEVQEVQSRWGDGANPADDPPVQACPATGHVTANAAMAVGLKTPPVDQVLLVADFVRM